ncbi:hypothetical protein MTO96_036167 [Rhipicephalus appendiculatus]
MNAAMLVKCTPYREHIDVCYGCGRPGHRADVCPNPNDKVCRGCGSKNAVGDHMCEVECQLRGKDHPLERRGVRQDTRYHTWLGDVAGNWRAEKRRRQGQRALKPANEKEFAEFLYKEFSEFHNNGHKETTSK